MAFWNNLAMADCQGNVRADVKDFSQSKFQIQVLYNTGWETLSEPDPFMAEQEWSKIKKRYRNINLRLLQDGKVIRSS